MSFPAYSVTNETSIPWLGKIPSHWELTRVKHCLTSLGSGGTPSTDDPALWTVENGIPWVAIGDMSDRSEIVETNKQITTHGLQSKNLTVWPAGTLLFSMYASIGHVAELRLPAAINQAIIALQPNASTHQGFLRWWFLFLRPHLLQDVSSNTQDNLNAEKVRNLFVVKPTEPEQATIASFLDRETSKIDALIDEQKRLIDLLKEKRQAVISHAVTKGLNPDAPLKDSGIDWLGMVPAHWEVSKVKYLCSHVVDCLHTTPTYEGDLEYPAIRTADIERGKLLLNEARKVSRDVYEERIQRLAPVAGDILYSREGERFGMAALVPLGVNLCLGQRMMMFRVNAHVSSSYLMWTLNSESVFQQVLEKVGGATSPHVNISDVVNFSVPEPPKEEQEEIARHLAEVTNSMDQLASVAEEGINLLQERRSALVSAAVTGKIDVRGLVGNEKAYEMEIA